MKKELLIAVVIFLGVCAVSVYLLNYPFCEYFAGCIEDGDFLNDWLMHLPVYVQSFVLFLHGVG